MALRDYPTMAATAAAAAADTSTNNCRHIAGEQYPLQDHMINTATLITNTRHCTAQQAPPATPSSASEYAKTRHCSSRQASSVAAAVSPTSECASHHAWKESIVECARRTPQLMIDVSVADNPGSFRHAVSYAAPTSASDVSAHANPYAPARKPEPPAVLVERWTLELAKVGMEAKEKSVRLANLQQAMKSTLLFSQLQSWLTLAEGRWHVAINYKLANMFEFPRDEDFPLPPTHSGKQLAVNSFPAACVDAEHVLRVRCLSLRYSHNIPFASPELIRLVAKRRDAACSRSSASSSSTSAARTARARFMAESLSPPPEKPPRSNKRRSKLLKDPEHEAGSGVSSTCGAALLQLSTCSYCGAVSDCEKNTAGRLKRKSHSKARKSDVTESQPSSSASSSSSSAAASAAQLVVPAQPVRVKSPPRPISPVVYWPAVDSRSSDTPSLSPMSTSSGGNSSYDASLPYRQNSAPLPHIDTSSSEPSSHSERGGVAALRSVCSSSLLGKESVAKISYRRMLQSDNVFVGSPHPSMLAPHQTPTGLRRRTSWSGPLSTSPLLGTFEESMFAGRLTPASSLAGYRLHIRCRCVQCNTSASHDTLDLQTDFFETESGAPSPYLGTAKAPRESFHVSRKGILQAILIRPSGSVLRVFLVPYDLSHLECGMTTFIRQRVMSSSPSADASAKPTLLYAIHFSLRRSDPGGALHLHKQIRVVFSPLPPDVYDVADKHKLVTDTLGPHIPTATQSQLLCSEELGECDAAVTQSVADVASPMLSPIAYPMCLQRATSSHGVHSTATTTTTCQLTAASTRTLLSPQELLCKKQEVAAELATQGRCSTPPPLRVP